MITPNTQFLNIPRDSSKFVTDLSDGPIVIETGHSGEASVGEVWGVGVGNEAVGVGGVADDKDTAGSGGVVVEGFSLVDEYLSVCL